MESKSIKIKDYVTHERVPVRGDSHGNFTLSPLGFPFVNRSGYERGGQPPRTFSTEMLVKPDLTEREEYVQAILEYHDEFKFPRTDSDHDTFRVNATLKNDGLGYSISTKSATFYSGCRVTVVVKDVTYEAVNGDYTVPTQKQDYIVPERSLALPEDGVECTVTFRPELTEISPMLINFTDSGENSGLYKLVVSTDAQTGVLHYTWMYKTSNAVKCSQPVTFDKGDNDNVYDHYRNRVSDQEVAEYIKNGLWASVDCGKFRGAEYPADANGLLVKWFLSRGAIVHSVAGKTVVLDGFGHMTGTSDLGDCSGTDYQDTEHGQYNIGPMHKWVMSTEGTNDYEDYPSSSLAGKNNNLTLEVEKSGEHHTIIIQQDLANMVTTPPRKTFIHLPTGLDIADGTEVELNIALPVISQPSGGDDVSKAIKAYTDYVSQPRVYILSGKQTTLPNNSVTNNGITTGDNTFTLMPRHPIDTEASQVAFGLFNKFECQKTYRFVGTVNATPMGDGYFWNNDRSSVLFNSGSDVPVKKGDYMLLKYTARTPIIGKVANKNGDTITVDFGRELKKPYNHELDYEVEYNDTKYYPSLVTGDSPLYEFDLDNQADGIAVGDLLDFVAFEEYTEEKCVVSKSSSDDGTIVVFSTPVVGEPEGDGIYGLVTSITVSGKPFPYNTSSRRWKLYSKDATCMVDIRTVDEEYGLTEHTMDSGAYSDDSSEEPELIDNDSIIATIYPTSTNTFPWRLNGRNRVRHLGLITNADIDYVADTESKPLTRLVFEMNKRVYDALDTMFHGAHLASDLRYDEEDTSGTPGNSILATLLRVSLPKTLDADIDDENAESMYVVSNATKAFHDLIGDFKISRVGYVSTRDYDNKSNTRWGTDSTLPTPGVDLVEGDNLQRLDDWETKIIHLPNCCLGVDENLERDLAYAGWNEYTSTNNFRIFYNDALDELITFDGSRGNIKYIDSKDAAGTTQRTVDNYAYDVDGDIPFNYTAEHSILKLFLTNPNTKTLNRYVTLVNGFLDLPVIKRGLRSISWLDVDSEETDALKRECEFACRDMEPFYPSSHVLSTDGIAFPEVDRSELNTVAQNTPYADQMPRELLAFPDKLTITHEPTTQALPTELISVNMPNNTLYDVPKTVINYTKSLLTMYSNGMPLHMYDAHRAINVYSPEGPYGQLLYAHEVELYNKNASGDVQRQHLLCDLATNGTVGQDSEDVNMTYNFITDSNTDPLSTPVSLTTPLENVSSEYIKQVFGPKTDEDENETTHIGMYTRVHVSATFSASLGRWVVKDYRQYPTCYLTPLYGAKTIDYTEKSYAYGNPRSYANRVQMNAGMANKTFSVSKYIDACEKQPLWQLPCGVGSDYRDGLYTRYSEQAPLEMNPGCIPFLMKSFPYGNDGKLDSSVRFRNLYESISTPMDASGEPKEGSVPEVNFWNIKLHVRPARSAYPGADIPSNTARAGGSIAEPTLGMFGDFDDYIEGEIILTDDANTDKTEYLIEDLAHIGPDAEVEPGDESVPYVILTDSDEYGPLVYDEPDPEGSSVKYVAIATDNPLSPGYTD